MNYSEPIYSVSELTEQIKILLEDSFPSLWIEGEISNYKKHYSGHLYFTLKDAESQISCVMWKSRAQSLAFQIEDGMKIQIFGNIRLYAKSGRYQVDALIIQQAGLGNLQLKLEELKKNLFEEGLFDEEFKKLLPKIPQNIGVITSPTGAAIKDIISVLQRRFPVIEITVIGVKVQGEGAAKEIVSALKQMNSIDGIDLIIAGRGGGSLEDLWAFNEEEVARAIFASEIPIISAVGHEIDFTIADFVADLRAPTPSVAAELAVPNAVEIAVTIRNYENILQNRFYELISGLKDRIDSLVNSYAFRRPEDIIHNNYQKIDNLINNINFYYINYTKQYREHINHLLKQLSALKPQHVLKRGYAMIYKDDKLVKSVKQVEIDDSVVVQLNDGSLNSLIIKKNYE